MVFPSSPPPGGECREEEETRSGDDGEEDGDEYDDLTIAFVVVLGMTMRRLLDFVISIGGSQRRGGGRSRFYGVAEGKDE